MFVFLLSQLPLPLVIFLNLRVTLRFMKVRRLSKHVAIERPLRLVIGWWIGNIAMIFALIPPIMERRIFVQDTHWLVSYAISATLTITGLLLMNSALGEELKELARPRRRKSLPKPVDSSRSDTL